MNKRLIIFVICLICAFASLYTQETNNAMVAAETMAAQEAQNVMQSDMLAMPMPPVMQQPETTNVKENQAENPVSHESNEINIGLSIETRQKMVTLLNTLLADEFVLYVKTLKCHWNVQGIVFHDFHALFKEQYEKLFEFVDLIAERARALGAPALGSLKEFSTVTQLQEMDKAKLSPLEMINALLKDHATIIRTIRKDIEIANSVNDQGTSNFLQDLIIKHEKLAWMLRATAR